MLTDEQKALMDQVRQQTPLDIARSLCDVQPMGNVDYVALMNDPLAQVLVTRFVERLKGDKE
jgi:hypothetical protein